ncbi:MAG: hypothetical protein J1E63_05230 [Muribaculaceae bacterium]|nr:hypothetical protein [Muribaculaceae bacterium]
MTRRYILPVLAIAMVSLVGCQKQTSETATSTENVPKAEIAPLYKQIEAFDLMPDTTRVAFIDSNREALEALSVIYNEDLTDSPTLRSLSQRPSTVIFSQAVDSLLPAATVDSVEIALGLAFANMNRELPQIPIPRLYGIIYPVKDRWILTVDDIMFIGLNHFLGAEFDGYNSMYNYQRLGKTPRRLPYNVIEALVATAYPFQPGEQNTALTRMVYNGALTMAMQKIVDKASLAETLNMTDDQLRWADENEKQIWQKMVADQMIFSTDPAIGDRLTLPAPNTPIIHPDAPGRIGTYIGYRIVASYLKNNPEATLEQVLSPEFYASPGVLATAGYNP